MHCSVTTPCPVSSSLDDILTSVDEPTGTIDFTSAFRASFRDVKPKRRHNQTVHFTIHEDADGDEDQPKRTGLRTALAQPPRRPQTVRQSQNATTLTEERVDGALSMHQTTRRKATRSSILPESVAPKERWRLMSPQAEIARPARRGTIYIPNEDTTMPSIYMGIFSPIKDLEEGQNTVKSPEQQMEITGIAAQMAVKRRSRNSMISEAPRRRILQTNVRTLQEKPQALDRPGQGGGKENIPPGEAEKLKSVEHPIGTAPQLSARRTSPRQSQIPTTERPSLYAQTTSSLLRSESCRSSARQDNRPRPAWNSGAKVKHTQPPQANCKRPQPFSLPAPRSVSPISTASTRLAVPLVPIENILHKHPVISEDITNPALYEEDWLLHQEVALTQLVNRLFQATKYDCSHDYYSLRRRLLGLYNSPSMVLMHRRLQANILYGTLSIPQDVLDQGTRLQNDIGLRKGFIDLWLCTYNLQALEIALEVVIGRECGDDFDRSGESPLSSKTSKQKLRHFIESFLIRNEDSKRESDTTTRVASAYQKTVLRSLLLVKVLDLIKSELSTEMTVSLFQHASSFKSSASVVQALMQMLNPAAGDPTRALGLVDYTVSHVQHPLEEFDYHIENLATDLRDGVRLTRLVELLLYPTSSPVLEKTFDNATMTVIMPEGEIVEFCDGQERPLSRHLKTNCQSRAVRLWNVQLALSALENVKGIKALVDGIAANDIVDGFREKTIRLLWALVGKWGLKGLINWQDLKWETRRLESCAGERGHETLYDDDDSDVDENEMTFEVCRRHLQRWARAAASSQGHRIQNFTTAFADGRAFEAIVGEYEPLIGDGETHLDKNSCLRERLARLGCSVQFSHLFVDPHQTHVFDRDFVLATLAFLCSRLLAPTQRIRAAIVVQQAWRRHWRKVEQGRKQEKRKVAIACAELVNSRSARATTVTNSSSSDALRPETLTRFDGSITNDAGSAWSPSRSEEDVWLTL